MSGIPEKVKAMNELPFETFPLLDDSVPVRTRGPIIKERIETIFKRMKDANYKFPAEPGNDIFGVNITEVARWCGMKNRNPFYKNENYTKMLKEAIRDIGISGEVDKTVTESLLEKSLDDRQRDIGALKRQVQTLTKEKSLLAEKVASLSLALEQALADVKDSKKEVDAIHERVENQRQNLLESGGRGYQWLK